MYNTSVNVGKTHIAAPESERQLLMMDAQLMQDCGVNIVNLKSILGH